MATVLQTVVVTAADDTEKSAVLARLAEYALNPENPPIISQSVDGLNITFSIQAEDSF